MAERCGFCKEQIDLPIRNKLIDVRMFMFKRIMKQHFATKQLARCPLCDKCDQTLQNFYNCKADLASSNRDFLNYMDSDNKLNLYQALVSMGRLERFKNESSVVKVCRICFKASQNADYREVKSWDGPLAMMITLCLPEFDININLTDHAYVCPECYSSLLQYNCFLSCCLEATKVTKPKKRQRIRNLDDPDQLELTPNDLKEKRQNMCSEVVIEKVSSEPLPITTFLIPKKGNPDRTRNGEEVNKQSILFEELTKKKPRLVKNMKRDKTNFKKVVLRYDYECQVCSKVLSDIHELNTHMGEHKKETKFLCRNCGFSCTDFKELKVHFVEQKIDLFRIIGVSQLPKKCQAVLKDNVENQRDKKRMTSSTTENSVLEGMEQYECQICPGVFDNIELLRDHIDGHKSGHNFKCWKCGKKTYSFGSFRQHFMKHGFIDIYERKLNLLKDCPSYKNKSKDVGKNPVLSSKSIATGITCPTCEETLNNLKEYLDHSCASSSEPTSKISCTSCSCGYCLKMFHTVDDLVEHNCNGVQISSVDIEDKTNEATILPKTEDLDRPEIKKEELNLQECIGTYGTVSDRIEDVTSRPDNYAVKKEDLFECFSCLCFFDTEDKLSRHMCTTKTVEAVYNITEDLESKIKTEEIDLGKIENFEL